MHWGVTVRELPPSVQGVDGFKEWKVYTEVVFCFNASRQVIQI